MTNIYSHIHRNNEDLSAIVLDSKFLCNVESVSRHHPNNVVCILLHLPSYHTTLRKLADKLFSLNKHKIRDKKVRNDLLILCTMQNNILRNDITIIKRDDMFKSISVEFRKT